MANEWGSAPSDDDFELELGRSIGDMSTPAQPPQPSGPSPPPTAAPIAPPAQQPAPSNQPPQPYPPQQQAPHAAAQYASGAHAAAPYPTGGHAPAPVASGAYPPAMPTGAHPMAPAAAPARPDFTGQNPAQVRHRYQDAERQVRHAGAALVVLGGLYAVLAGMWLGGGGIGMVIGLAAAVLTVASFVFGRLLRQLAPEALKWSQAIAGIALVYIPFGTACGAYILAMLTKAEARTVLSPEYKAVCEATAQMDPPPSIVPWVAATLLVLVGLAQCAFCRPPNPTASGTTMQPRSSNTGAQRATGAHAQLVDEAFQGLLATCGSVADAHRAGHDVGLEAYDAVLSWWFRWLDLREARPEGVLGDDAWQKLLAGAALASTGALDLIVEFTNFNDGLHVHDAARRVLERAGHGHNLIACLMTGVYCGDVELATGAAHAIAHDGELTRLAWQVLTRMDVPTPQVEFRRPHRGTIRAAIEVLSASPALQ